MSKKVFCYKCKYYRPHVYTQHQEQCRKIILSYAYPCNPLSENRDNDCRGYKFSFIRHFLNYIWRF